MIHRQAVFGTLVDDARERWLALKAQADEATAKTLAAAAAGKPDPALSLISNRLNTNAAVAEQVFKATQAAAEEARTTPLRTIDLRKTRQVREEIATGQKPGVSLGTVAILASPLALAALLVWRMR